MQEFKNVSLAPVDVGGRVLAVGEVAELSPHNHAVHQAVSTGELLAVSDGEPDEEPAPEPVAEPEKPRKSTARRASQTSTEES